MTITASLEPEVEIAQAPVPPGVPQTRALAAFAALGQPTRLSMLRLLVSHEPCGMTVGDIAQELHCPQNTTSGHLAILARAGLVQATRKGRSVVYRADLTGVRWLVEYLLADCCNGDPSACANLFADVCAPQCAQTQVLSQS
jgi:ArsR family transcriptional regulator, arsenate/arsenite/antimonite-responsive transcriptional repressor